MNDRRSVYRLLTIVTVGMMTARVASSERVWEPSLYREPRGDAAAIMLPLAGSTCGDVTTFLAAGKAVWDRIDRAAPQRDWPRVRPQPMPTFGSNDRSRWATIRALVEDGTFVIGQRTIRPDGSYVDSGRVFAPGYDSVDKVMDPDTLKFYSSKPPLLTCMFACEYWLFYQIGLDLDRHPWLTVRLIVWTANVLPLCLFLLSFASLIERYGATEWGRLFTFATACFGTFLSTFAITLNNHVPAAVMAYFAVRSVLAANEDEHGFTWGRVVSCGIFAGLAACFELPATALLFALFVGLLLRCPMRTIAGFLSAALVPIVLQLGLNTAAIGDPIPVYAKLGSADSGIWYAYPGSHWREAPGEVKRGIDWAKRYENRPTYAFHLLAGHHGVFSLSPVWLLSFATMIVVARHGGWLSRPECLFQHILLMTFCVSLVVIVFFAAIVTTANYGGWTSGARWFFWLIPLWLMALVPAADRLASTTIGRAVGLVCIGISVFSASYPAANPWRHPWIYNWMDALGGIPY